MARSDDLARHREQFLDEIEGAAMYRGRADSESDPNLSELDRRLGATEERHGRLWIDKLEVPAGKLSGRNRPVLRLVATIFTIIALLGACNSEQTPDNDRTGEIGQEQGDLDRDVEDADEDPRQGPPDSP